ncbi:MAG: DUF3134 domain-containing protein [Moorea sp. SIO2B7]|nr:DUF3134 domain-containing protein [Moorena sp. SIO2B7]
MYNPSLRQEPRYEPATVIPLKQESSLLDWLEANGRIIPREVQEKVNDIEDDVEISELMDVDDHDFVDDDHSDDQDE